MGYRSELKQQLIGALIDLGKTEAAGAVRERGEPISNPFFWPDPRLPDAETELFFVVMKSRASGWKLDDRSTQWFIRQLLWDAFKEPRGEKQIEEAVSTFLSKISISLAHFRVLVPIEGLQPVMSVIPIEKVKIGPLERLVEPEIARKISERSDGKFSVWAYTEVDAPAEQQIPDAAVQILEAAIDLLATLDNRAAWFGGFPGEVRVGPYGFFLGKDEPISFTFPNQWGKGLGFNINPETAKEEPRLEYMTGPFPWHMLPQGSELATALMEAYRRFGHAGRVCDDAEAAIPLSLSAIESLLADRFDKSYSTTARIMLASAALNAPIKWPIALVGDFLERNDILHEPSQVRWTEDDSSRAFRSLYRLLDLISNFIIVEKLTTKRELVERLAEPANVELAKKSIEAQIAQLKSIRQHAFTTAYQKELDRQVEAWKNLEKRLSQRSKSNDDEPRWNKPK